MPKYQVTIGYKAVISIEVKAETENEAKDKALKIMKSAREKIRSSNLNIEDDSFKADGILNMDETWGIL